MWPQRVSSQTLCYHPKRRSFLGCLSRFLPRRTHLIVGFDSAHLRTRSCCRHSRPAAEVVCSEDGTCCSHLSRKGLVGHSGLAYLGKTCSTLSAHLLNLVENLVILDESWHALWVIPTEFLLDNHSGRFVGVYRSQETVFREGPALHFRWIVESMGDQETAPEELSISVARDYEHSADIKDLLDRRKL